MLKMLVVLKQQWKRETKGQNVHERKRCLAVNELYSKLKQMLTVFKVDLEV